MDWFILTMCIYNTIKYLLATGIALLLLCSSASAGFLKDDGMTVRITKDNIVGSMNSESQDFTYLNAGLTFNAGQLCLNNFANNTVQDNSTLERSLLQLFAGSAVMFGGLYGGLFLIKHSERDVLEGITLWILTPVLVGLTTHFVGENYDETIDSSLGSSIGGAYIGFLIGLIGYAEVSVHYSGDVSVPLAFAAIGVSAGIGSIIGFIRSEEKKNTQYSILNKNGDFNIPVPEIIAVSKTDMTGHRTSEIACYVSLYSYRF
jgi:hypothetical protein